MSVILLSHRHVFVLADYVNEPFVLKSFNVSSTQELAKILFQHNVNSYNQRYNANEINDYEKQRRESPVDEIQILKALDTFVNNVSCDLEFANSLAEALCNRIRNKAIRHLDGFDEREWELY